MKKFTLKLILIFLTVVVLFTVIILRTSYKNHKKREANKTYNELKYELENAASNKKIDFQLFGSFYEKYSSCADELSEDQKRELLQLRDSVMKKSKTSINDKNLDN
ncbi:hypothetical protein [Flavobacterium sp.]|uniref:hypothetical protein n=1 Tax=Flavobacterium sp. TaxID=239 RepID=UPI003F699793